MYWALAAAIFVLSIPVVLVGRDLGTDHGLEVLEASQVIAMDADPGNSVRTSDRQNDRGQLK